MEGLDTIREEGNSHGDGEANVWYMSARPSLTVVHRENFEQKVPPCLGSSLIRFLPVYHT